jgi:hypothetical protein
MTEQLGQQTGMKIIEDNISKRVLELAKAIEAGAEPYRALQDIILGDGLEFIAGKQISGDTEMHQSPDSAA